MARYVRAKCFKGETLVVRANASPLRKAIAAQHDKLHKCSRWIVGSGQRWFWLDNWAGKVKDGFG